MPRLLVHCCCVHCSAYTFNYWLAQGYDVTAYWYNPNIHPFTEHKQRLEALRVLVEKDGFTLIEEPGYDLERYFQAVNRRENARCSECYRIRLEAVAEFSKANGFDGFTSSLLISPQQKHDQILEAARTVEQLSGAKFEYADLRKYYSDSRKLTKPLELYRQQYCGCLYSEYERYGDNPST